MVFAIIIILCSVLRSDCSENQTCFTRNSDEFCYNYHGYQQINWTDAERYCNENYNEGHLASIHNEDETLTMYNLINQADTNGMEKFVDCWIGLHDSTSNSVAPRLNNQWYWQWSDGSPFEYSHWHVGYESGGMEPTWSSSRRQHQQSCVEAYFGKDFIYEGEWNNDPCWKKEECFICQSKTLNDRSSVLSNPAISLNNTSKDSKWQWTILLAAVLSIINTILLVTFGVRHCSSNRMSLLKCLIINTVSDIKSMKVKKTTKHVDERLPIVMNDETNEDGNIIFASLDHV